MKWFGSQNELWIKVNLDPMVRLKGLNKINVHKINDIIVFNDHRVYVCGWLKITKKRIEKKCNQL
jgi:hypothetical protein